MFEKLKLNKDFRRIYGRGKSFVHPEIVTYIYKNKSSENVRYGITVSKKLGKAVKRNRAKRLITAAVSPYIARLKPGTDMVFVARTRIFSVKSYQISDIIKADFISAGVLLKEDNDQ